MSLLSRAGRGSVLKSPVLAGLAILMCLVGLARGQANAEATAFSGQAVESIDAAGYTYVLVATGGKKVWVAAPKFEVKAGDKVAVREAMPMPNYQSKSLKRTFDLVYFTGSVTVNDKSGGAAASPAQGLPRGHPNVDGKKAAPATDFSKITRPSGGKTVSEIVDGSKQLKGKEVSVRGKVVKYNEGVMGKNWLHIRDGSGTAANNDLTVTTAAPAKVGDTVLVKGKVSTERNFGGGYFYNVIIEDAKVTVE